MKASCFRLWAVHCAAPIPAISREARGSARESAGAAPLRDGHAAVWRCPSRARHGLRRRSVPFLPTVDHRTRHVGPPRRRVGIATSIEEHSSQGPRYPAGPTRNGIVLCGIGCCDNWQQTLLNGSKSCCIAAGTSPRASARGRALVLRTEPPGGVLAVRLRSFPPSGRLTPPRRPSSRRCALPLAEIPEASLARLSRAKA